MAIDLTTLSDKQLDQLIALQRQKLAFLPKVGQVEQQISQRQAPLQFRMPTTGNRAFDFLTRTPRAAIGGLQLGRNILQRAEAALANPALSAQRRMGIPLQEVRSLGGRYSPATQERIRQYQKSVGKQIRQDIGAGLRGERLGQLEDVVRTTGFGGRLNELFAKAVGLGVFIGISNLVTKGLLTKGVNVIKRAFKAKAQAPIRITKLAFKQQSDALAQGTDDIITGIGKEYAAIDKKIGNFPLNRESMVEVQDIAARLPKRIVDNIAKRAQAFGKKVPIREEFTGRARWRILKPEVNSANMMKREIGKSIPDKVWSGLQEATPEQLQLMQDYKVLRNIVTKNIADDALRTSLAELNGRYDRLMDYNKVVKSLTRKNIRGKIVTSTKLRGIRGEALEGELAELQNFANEFLPQTNEIIRNIDKINRMLSIRKAVQSTAGTAARIGVGAEVGRRLFFNPLQESIESIGGGQQF